jgi:hypothetical protein
MKYEKPEVLSGQSAAAAIQGSIPKEMSNNDSNNMPSVPGYEADE